MGEREALQAMGRSSTMGPDAVAAATVILVRPDASVLMLKRDSKLAFAGGLWVFPGGRVDPGDYDGSGSLEVAERRAAVREAMEEAGLVIDPDALLRFSHWTPPPQAQKRFSTAFFVASAPDGAVVIDDGEIRFRLAVLEGDRRLDPNAKALWEALAYDLVGLIEACVVGRLACHGLDDPPFE